MSRRNRVRVWSYLTSSEVELKDASTAALLFDSSESINRCERSTLVLTSAGEFAQDKLLGQTAGNMQAHANPKILEYMRSITI